MYHEPLINNRNGNTTHNNTENLPVIMPSGQIQTWF